jgi:uncharacterized protein (DUF1330 family)
MAAYLVATAQIDNFTEDMKTYVQRSEALVHQAGGQYLVRGPGTTVYEGDFLTGRHVIVSKFPSMDALKSFVESDEYQNVVKPLRAGTGTYDIAAFEGADDA